MSARTFFWQPRPLKALFWFELLERYAYFAVRGTIVFRLIDDYSDVSRLANVFAFFFFAVYLFTGLGGWIGDRYLGRRRAVQLGAAVALLGYGLVAIPTHATTLVGLIVIAAGTGLIKPNAAVLASDLYGPTDRRIDTGFTIYYVGINIGAFLAAAILFLDTSLLQAILISATAAMMVANLIIGFGSRALPAVSDLVPDDRESRARPVTLFVLAAGALSLALFAAPHAAHIDTILGITTAAGLVVLLAWGLRRTRGSTADDTTNRTRLVAVLPLFVGALMFEALYEAGYAASFDPAVVAMKPGFRTFINLAGALPAITAPLLAAVWIRLRSRNREPLTMTKLGVGMLMMTAGMGLGFANQLAGGTAALPIAFVVTGAFVEASIVPVGMAAVVRLAPRAWSATTLALWSITSTAGLFVAHLSSRVSSTIETRTSLFASLTALAAFLAIMFLRGATWFQKLLRRNHVDPVTFRAVARAEKPVEIVQTAAMPMPASPIPVLLEVDEPDWKPPNNVTISSRVGGIISARVSDATALRALADDPHVVRIGGSGGSCVPECAESVPFIMGTTAAPREFDTDRGAGVLIAIIDSGIDVLHRCFRDKNGKSRVLGIWDQRAKDGRSPHAVDSAYDPDYGRFHTNDDIAGYLTSGAVPESLGRDPEKHGTHVASIAAGCATGTFAGGVAPEAQILVVIPAMRVDAADPTSIGYSSSHVDALGFIERFGLKHDLPVVVNISLGMNAGAHDGKSLLEAACDAFTSYRRGRGHVIVKSAGNEFGHGGHAELQPSAMTVQRIQWRSESYHRQTDYFEAWYDAAHDLEFVLEDPKGNRSPVVSTRSPREIVELGGNRCELDLVDLHPDNGDSRLTIEVDRAAAPIQEGVWQLAVTGKRVVDRRPLHMWVERNNARPVRFEPTAGATNALTLSIPGTAQRVITVGAIRRGEPFELMSASSHGPTRDDRSKPVVCAPGDAIIAAEAGTDDQTIAMTGTSQAAPHVAGAIARLYSRQHRLNRPYSNAHQIESALKSTVRSTGSWHPGFGYGVIDVVRFVTLLCRDGAG